MHAPGSKKRTTFFVACQIVVALALIYYRYLNYLTGKRKNSYPPSPQIFFIYATVYVNTPRGQCEFIIQRVIPVGTDNSADYPCATTTSVENRDANFSYENVDCGEQRVNPFYDRGPRLSL